MFETFRVMVGHLRGQAELGRGSGRAFPAQRPMKTTPGGPRGRQHTGAAGSLYVARLLSLRLDNGQLNCGHARRFSAASGCGETRAPAGELLVAPALGQGLPPGLGSVFPSWGSSTSLLSRWRGRGVGGSENGGLCRDNLANLVLDCMDETEARPEDNATFWSRPHCPPDFFRAVGMTSAILGLERHMGVSGAPTHVASSLSSLPWYPFLRVLGGIRLPLPRQPPPTRNGSGGSVTSTY